MVYPALLPPMRTPRLPVVDWTDDPRRFKWTRPFRRKTKYGFCECAITFQLASTTHSHLQPKLKKKYSYTYNPPLVWTLRYMPLPDERKQDVWHQKSLDVIWRVSFVLYVFITQGCTTKIFNICNVPVACYSVAYLLLVIQWRICNLLFN